MGGHGLKRSAGAYKDVAHIAYQLGNSGSLLSSGGGPGAMEATHLGALFSKRPIADSTLLPNRNQVVLGPCCGPKQSQFQSPNRPERSVWVRQSQRFV